MKKQLRWSLTIITLLSLTGCGLKGPLYFPPAASVSMHNMDKAQPEKWSKNLASENRGSKDNISMGA
ncbi:LPS translocon maturation chaperone LptM [Xenorhabdus poinarii]|nr:lipoprotein [Xenorhabdus poinarii]